MPEVRIATAGHFASIDFTPGDLLWDQFDSSTLRNSVNPASPLSDRPFTHIGIAADGNTGGVRLAMRAVAAGDAHTNEIRVPPGFVMWFDIRGLRNADAKGLKIFSVALEDAADSITIYAELD